MTEILSQNEIDNLIASLVEENDRRPPGAARAPAAPQRRVRSYDFRRPDKFSKDQLRTLQMLHENFARLLTTFFSANFRTMVQMIIGSVDQMTYQEFIQSVSNPSVLSVFRLHPLQGTCVLDINPLVAFPMLDRLFGGPGATLGQPRPLTEIETSVMQRVIGGSLAALSDAWRNIIEVEPQLEAVETNPLFVQAAAPGEIVVGIAIDVRVGEHVGVITLCLPFMTLEPILAKLSAQNWFAAGGRELKSEQGSELKERVGAARITVAARLGAVHLTVEEVLGLGVGDVLVLDQGVDDRVTVCVGNRPKFVGRPGTVRGKLAVAIDGLSSGHEEDEGHVS